MNDYKLITINSDHVKTADVTGTMEENAKKQKDSMTYETEMYLVFRSEHSLEQTKLALEQLLRHSKTHEFRLILVANGTTQEVVDYFKQVSHSNKRVYHLTHKINWFHFYDRIEGLEECKYFVHTTAGVLVSPQWLERLFACLLSSEDIASVIPLAVHGNNKQDPSPEQSSTMEAFLANEVPYGQSDPRKWEERQIFQQEVALYRTDHYFLKAKTPEGYFYGCHQIAHSLQIARTGNKQMICCDVLVYYIPEPLSFDMSVHQAGLEQGVANFKEAFWGLHPWDDFHNFESDLLSLGQYQKKNPDVLGINVKCGAPFYEIKQRLQENGQMTGGFTAFTTDPLYYNELLPVCQGRVTHGAGTDIASTYSVGSFDYIVVGDPINWEQFPSFQRFLATLMRLLRPQGQVFFTIKNTLDVATLQAMSGNVGSYHNQQYKFLDIEYMFTLLEGLPIADGNLKPKESTNQATTDQAETVLSIFSEESIKKLQTESYLLCFTKG